MHNKSEDKSTIFTICVNYYYWLERSLNPLSFVSWRDFHSPQIPQVERHDDLCFYHQKKELNSPHAYFLEVFSLLVYRGCPQRSHTYDKLGSIVVKGSLAEMGVQEKILHHQPLAPVLSFDNERSTANNPSTQIQLSGNFLK